MIALRVWSGAPLALFLAGAMAAQDGVLVSRYHAGADFALTADPDAAPWKGVAGVIADKGYLSEPRAEIRTEIRSRWTDRSLYLLYICPFETLNLKPDPSTTAETNRLWNWDVAEAFIGSDFENIARYKEFQVSPQGEWVDLDINRADPKAQQGAAWNSGFEVKARIDRERKIWYGEMRIPFAAIDSRQPQPGNELRAGLYRITGVEPNKKHLAWRPTGKTTFHVPEAFGRIRLAERP
jgi:hypothetical protein